MDDELKRLKKELEEHVFVERNSSQKKQIIQRIQKRKKAPFSLLQPVIHGLLTIFVLIGISYFIYGVLHGDDWSSTLGEGQSKAAIRESIEDKWRHPFNQFSTISGSYSFQDYRTRNQETIYYSIFNKKNELFKFSYSNERVSYTYQDGSNPEIDRINNCLTLDPEKKMFDVGSLPSQPKEFLKQMGILHMFPDKISGRPLAGSDTWESIKTGNFLDRKVYTIKGVKKSGGTAAVYDLIVDRQTGFVLSLTVSGAKGEKLYSLQTSRFSTNSGFPENYFDFTIPNDYQPKSDTAYFFKNRQDQIRGRGIHELN
ncbi:PRC-barrel domain-containing protein [Peribacillus kribbensis]|uniref:PRC-barrel domain-containing protein n=1 Tax=Peribacillus kribbensis TaxID=356658 RepID=UPI00040974CA|nr:PRC-barrel domain-containing protein [Peribacillus kribbensis]